MRAYDLDLQKNYPCFIGSWLIEPEEICDEIISFYDKNVQLHSPGLVGLGLCEDAKKTTDLSINPKQLDEIDYDPIKRYINLLFDCYKNYNEHWGLSVQLLSKLEIGPFNIQRYDIGGHFSKIHSERTTLETAHRVFAWMTYLNDVTNGGETTFVNFGINVKPKKGLTLIWPAEWTHAHFGGVVNEGNKYIITGWLHFAL